MAGYVRQALANIANGLTIFAADINAEFNQLVAAFNGTTGHTHDGTTGSGPKVSLVTSVSGVLPAANGGTGGINKLDATTDPTVNEDSNDGYTVGSWWINVTGDKAYLCVDATVGNAIWQRFNLYDLDLTAIAALTSAADKIPYATGAGTWALTDFSVYARTLVDDTTALAARTTLGVAIGVDVQAYDADLAAIAALTSAADKGIQFTGLGTAATYTLTTYAKTLLDDADASTTLTTLGFSAYGKTLIDDADASAALSTLGVSSYIKTLLDDADALTARTTLGVDTSSFQPFDTTLTALAAFNTNGILTQTAADTFVGRTLTGTANELTVTNGNGVSGNPTISLPASLTLTGKTMTGGTYTGMTDIVVADGGTGVSTLTGLAKGNGTSAFTAAVQGTDYWAPGGTDVVVADGGTGVSSVTAYAVLTGGTTSTGPLQSIASVGTATQVLTSNGPAALPTMQDIPIQSPIVLLGTMTTTSGSSQSLTSLVLTSYSFLRLVLNTSTNGSVDITLNSNIIASFGVGGAGNARGMVDIDLNNGVMVWNTSNSAGSPAASVTGGGLSGLTTASTTVTVSVTGGGSFDAGSIRVYGLR